MDNIKELKEYLISLDLGITDVRYIPDNGGDIEIISDGYSYPLLNVSGSTKYGVMIDICYFLKKYF